MTYIVLARSWRPKTFHSLEGQEHVLRALINSLDNQRLHHAYLFTGTRGVGKTTIARILAKCLNCETGITSKPCGICNACTEIDEGRFVDLIEVDAASRTKVEDTRELLNNVQYAPTSGRFKIYLIDEVHMLSGHSFNALLKTLEEPPPHVKFLLATTDPQKLPVTVLSRCLQFNLKNISAERIAAYLEEKITKENIPFEKTALLQIGKAANGSMRDALSLLDQAIGFSKGNISAHEISQMLGTIEKTHIEKLVQAVLKKDAAAIIKIAANLEEMDADFNNVLEELIAYLHQIAILQAVPNLNTDAIIVEISKRFSPEEIQLYYQIAIIGRRDLPLAVTAKSGFEMVLLRMLAFSLSEPVSVSVPVPEKITPVAQPVVAATTDFNWNELVKKLPLKGMVHSLAANCAVKLFSENSLELVLDKKHAALLNENLKNRLNEVINKSLNKKIKLTINVEEVAAETPAEKEARLLAEKHKKAVNEIKNDENVQAIMEQFATTIDPDMVKCD